METSRIFRDYWYNHANALPMSPRPKIQSQEDLKKLQEESGHQQLPEQKKVFTVSPKLRKRVHNLPDPTRPPLGYDEKKAFDLVFPHINLPLLHPGNHGDTVIFNAPDLLANKLIFGDNLQVLRTRSLRIPLTSSTLILRSSPAGTTT